MNMSNVRLTTHQAKRGDPHVIDHLVLVVLRPVVGVPSQLFPANHVVLQVKVTLLMQGVKPGVLGCPLRKPHLPRTAGANSNHPCSSRSNVDVRDEFPVTLLDGGDVYVHTTLLILWMLGIAGEQRVPCSQFVDFLGGDGTRCCDDEEDPLSDLKEQNQRSCEWQCMSRISTFQSELESIHAIKLSRS